MTGAGEREGDNTRETYSERDRPRESLIGSRMFFHSVSLSQIIKLRNARKRSPPPVVENARVFTEGGKKTRHRFAPAIASRGRRVCFITASRVGHL